jgi:glycosyltransferase involved in cell wall biosynthesis
LSAPHLYIATPCYTGRVDLGTMGSLLLELPRLGDAGIKVTFGDFRGNSMIAHARSWLLAQFLGTTATHIVFVDDDITWEPGAMLRLVEHGVDFVAGIYPMRSDPLGFHCRFLKDRPELKGDPEHPSLLEVDGVPAGFMCVSRHAVEQMVLKYPKSRFADASSPNGFAWALFDNIHEGDVYYGEDYSFCLRHRRIGGRIFVDPEMKMSHVGMKAFTGSFGQWLKDRPAPVEVEA